MREVVFEGTQSMCGIAGFVHHDGRAAEESVLRAMCDAIVHRGPDADGMLLEGPVALGMRRLSIIDVAGGDQPIHSPDRRASIVFNGECYDFAAERARLEAGGRSFATSTDTEVALALYEKHGLDFVGSLRGMYGLAVWDRPEQRLVIVRDRIGQKPIHYFDDGQTFFFASEIKSILVGLARLGRPRPEVDPEAVVQYCGYGFVPDPLTIFSGIRKLPPAHLLVLEGAGLRTERYWMPSFEARPDVSEEAALEEAEAVIEEAIRIRMVSDVPLGAYLSGGVDSSVVCALMSKSATRAVKTFSIGFEDSAFDELPYARIVAEHLGTDHHEYTVRPDAKSVIDDIVRHFDEPFGDASAIPTFYVSKTARQEVTVALSGDGGDELFGGYHRYLTADAGGMLGKLPLGLRRATFGVLAKAMPAGAFGRGRLHDLALDDDRRFIHALTTGAPDKNAGIFTREFSERITTTDPSGPLLEKLQEGAALDRTTRRLRADTLFYLPFDIMTKVDRMSMMVSLEARSPLLDHKVVEFAAGLPLGLKIKGGEKKYLLSELARRLVPREVIDRRKQGFGVPVSRWLNNEWRSEADDHLGSLMERGIFDREALERLLDEHRRGRRDHGHLFWSLMMLEKWFRTYVDDAAFST